MSTREQHRSQVAQKLKLLRTSRPWQLLADPLHGNGKRKRNSPCPTQAEVAKAIGVTQPTYQKLERQYGSFNRQHVMNSMNVLKASAAERAEILSHVEMCAPSKEKHSTGSAGFYLEGFDTFCEREREAIEIRTYQGIQFSGLSQSDNYIFRQLTAGQQISDVSAAWEFRRARREVLDPRLSRLRSYQVIISQQVLESWPGGDDHNFVIEQLEYVLQLQQQNPNYKLRILPSCADGMFPPAVSFSILSFPDARNEVYFDTVTDVQSVIVRKRPPYEVTWDHLDDAAWSHSESTDYILRAINRRKALRGAEEKAEESPRPMQGSNANTAGGTDAE